MEREHNSTAAFNILLPEFEGPFDLLLFFIERDELDIRDIPIAYIADEFMMYLDRMEQLDIDVAGEFLLVASRLMLIKAKTLLPRSVTGPEDGLEDSKEKLIRHLIEYKKYKSTIPFLSLLEENRLRLLPRGNGPREFLSLGRQLGWEGELQSVNLFKLIQVYGRALDNLREKNLRMTHPIQIHRFSIEGCKKDVLGLLKSNPEGSVSFQDLVDENTKRDFLVFHLLAILELVNSGKIFLLLGNGFNSFWISLSKFSAPPSLSTKPTPRV